MIPSHPAADDQKQQETSTADSSAGNSSSTPPPEAQPANQRRVLSCSAINRMNPWAAARLRRYYQL
jgi:hypothetical protein